jgi:DNA-binding NarL/FixJ family response regulator
MLFTASYSPSVKTMETSATLTSASVMVVEDQTVVRQMLAAMIEATGAYKVVAQSGSAAEGLRLASALRPDIIVLDWFLGRESGWDFLDGMRLRGLKPVVLVFSGNISPAVVRKALQNGVNGFIGKTADVAAFREALATVWAGRTYLGESAAKALSGPGIPGGTSDPASEQHTLSDRELEVLKLVAEGFSSQEIADRLGISIRTINSHRASIIRKTRLQSVAELTRCAWELGLTAPLRYTAPDCGTGLD